MKLNLNRFEFLKKFKKSISYKTGLNSYSDVYRALNQVEYIDYRHRDMQVYSTVFDNCR